MVKVNLRDYYYWYTEDEFVEVEDEVAVALMKDKKYEHACMRRTFYNKAHYSIDAGDGIAEEAQEVFDSSDDPAILLELKERHCNLCRALNSLSDVQGRRIEAHYIFRKSQQRIARKEGVTKAAVNISIKLGLQNMKIFLKNPENRLNYCPSNLMVSERPAIKCQ